MKKTRLLASSLTALSLAFSGMAFAQGGPNNGHGRDDQFKQQQNQQRGGQNQPNRGQAPQHANNNDRGAGPDHNFRRGGRLSNEYRGKQYVVNDWRGHHLNAPPRGYNWVQTGGDYVLVAVATGIIAQILLGQ